MEVSQAITIVRDICFVGALLFGILKLGLWLKPAVDFFQDAKVFMKEVRQHMTVQETNMSVLMTNHIAHLEQAIKELAQRRDIGE